MPALRGPRETTGVRARSRVLSSLPYLCFAAALAGQCLIAKDSPGYFLFLSALFGVLNILGVIFSLVASRDRALVPAARRPWRFIAVYFALAEVSGILFGLAAPKAVLYPSTPLAIAVVARIISFLALVAGVLSLAHDRLDRRARYRFSMDITIVIGGAFMPMWYFLIGPALSEAAGVGFTRLSAPLFAIIDLIMIMSVFVVMLRGVKPETARHVQLILAGCVIAFAADAYTSYQMLAATGRSTTVDIIPLLALSSVLIISAAIERRRPARPLRHRRPWPRARNLNLWLPYVALLGGFGLLVTEAIRAGAYPWGGLIAGVIVMVAGVAARQIFALQENQALLATDHLTGLANRGRLKEKLRDALARNRDDHGVAVLLIDLDRFKDVNDSYGHEVGDAILITFAAVLHRVIRACDTAARFGGDEFAVVLDAVAGPAEATAVAQRVLGEAARPTLVADRPITIHASIGIAFVGPEDPACDPNALLRRADLAMYTAKRNRTGWACYDHVAAAPHRPDPVAPPQRRDPDGSRELRLDAGRLTPPR